MDPKMVAVVAQVRVVMADTLYMLERWKDAKGFARCPAEFHDGLAIAIDKLTRATALLLEVFP